MKTSNVKTGNVKTTRMTLVIIMVIVLLIGMGYQQIQINALQSDINEIDEITEHIVMVNEEVLEVNNLLITTVDENRIMIHDNVELIAQVIDIVTNAINGW